MNEEDQVFPKEGKEDSNSLSHSADKKSSEVPRPGTVFTKQANKMTIAIDKPDRKESNE